MPTCCLNTGPPNVKGNFTTIKSRIYWSTGVCGLFKKLYKADFFDRCCVKKGVTTKYLGKYTQKEDGCATKPCCIPCGCACMKCIDGIIPEI